MKVSECVELGHAQLELCLPLHFLQRPGAPVHKILLYYKEFIIDRIMKNENHPKISRRPAGGSVSIHGL